MLQCKKHKKFNENKGMMIFAQKNEFLIPSSAIGYSAKC